jgi:SAM-dependent methyltransferase
MTGANVRRITLAVFAVVVVAGVVVLRVSASAGDTAVRLAPRLSSALGIAVPAPRNTCPVCLHTLAFIPFGNRTRALAGCPYCGSLERHRLLYLYLRQKTNLFRDELSVLHFSPERGLSAALRSQRNLKYATSWYEADRPADFHLDLTNLAQPDNSWDVLIVYHILEHIPEDRKAMREMLRVLKPGGWAVVQVPTRVQPDTFEDPSIVTEKDRLEKYGKEDHVRFYGWKDFPDRLTQAGFMVTVEPFAHELTEGAIEEFALDRDERIYLLKKPL